MKLDNTKIKAVRKYQFPKLLKAIDRPVEFDKYRYDPRRKYTIKQLTKLLPDICVWSDRQEKLIFIITETEASPAIKNVFIDSVATEQCMYIPSDIMKFIIVMDL